MLVRDWMQREVVTIDDKDSMNSAAKLMKENNIKILPVMKKNKLVGIVTDRDLKRASASDATTLEIHELLYLLTSISVKSLMSKPPITVPADYTIEETAQVLLKNKISGVPVVGPKGEIIGIITQSDIFRALIELTGIDKRGILFAFQVENQLRSITNLIDIIQDYGGRIVSISSSYEDIIKNTRKAYIRLYDIDRGMLDILLERLSEKAKILYMIDYRENNRKIFS
jgi:acetoin utilization protein AcuB